MRRLRIGPRWSLIIGRAVSVDGLKITRPLRINLEKLRRLRLGRVELILGRAFSAMVRKVAPSPSSSEK